MMHSQSWRTVNQEGETTVSTNQKLDPANHLNAANDAAKADRRKLSPSMTGIGKLLQEQLAVDEETNGEHFAEQLARLAVKASAS